MRHLDWELLVERHISVLLVEDEVLIRMMISDMLADLGHRVIGEAGSIDEALPIAASAEFGLAILDVNLNGAKITPVARVIKARNLPIIFATGYGFAGLPEDFSNYPALQKPFQVEALAKAIDEVWKHSD
jgi:CheY-like chemotaxis protein